MTATAPAEAACKPHINSRIIPEALRPIAGKAEAGERLTFEDGVLLYQTPDLSAVGAIANFVREQRHGDRAYYVRNQHIN
ncbi:MAG: hypothetical protein KGK12_15015, partial [Armatimonadetes bacterium]|nr:hypothetical protein [Armatimonadota bacterium]